MRRGVAGLAAALLLSACSPAPAPLADAALSSGGADDDARTVYVAPVAEGCARAHLSGVVAYADRLVLSEDTCSPEAGADESTPQVRLVEAAASGVRELPLPDGVSETDDVAVLAAADDGTLFVRVRDEDLVVSLWQRSSGGAWSLLTRPAADGDGHAGDGGPASEAVVSDPQAIALGSDGSLYVLEPNAVRRITPDGIIETVAGSDRSDPPDLPSSLGWGSAGVGLQRPDPRPLPGGPVVATDFPLPRLTALDVAEDGTVWLASHDAVLRLGTDGLLAVHADATTVVPGDPSATLVGPRGLSSSITGLHVDGDALVLVDEWSATLLRLAGQRLSLVLGRSQAEPEPCPSPVLVSTVPADRVCAARYVQTRDGDGFVVHFGGVLAVPGELLG